MTVCWHEERPHRQHPCPGRGGPLIVWGRCRSGRRWFWTAKTHCADRWEHGWTDHEPQAIAEARAAVVQIAASGPAIAHMQHTGRPAMTFGR